MEQHRQQYLGEKIALIRNIREENKVRAQGGCNRVIQISVRIFLPIRLCVLSKRIYSSRVQLGVHLEHTNRYFAERGRSLFLPRVIYFYMFPVSSFRSFSTTTHPFFVRFLDNTRSFDFLVDAGGYSFISSFISFILDYVDCQTHSNPWYKLQEFSFISTNSNTNPAITKTFPNVVPIEH